MYSTLSVHEKGNFEWPSCANKYINQSASNIHFCYLHIQRDGREIDARGHLCAAESHALVHSVLKEGNPVQTGVVKECDVAAHYVARLERAAVVVGTQAAVHFRPCRSLYGSESSGVYSSNISISGQYNLESIDAAVEYSLEEYRIQLLKVKYSLLHTHTHVTCFVPVAKAVLIKAHRCLQLAHARGPAQADVCGRKLLSG